MLCMASLACWNGPRVVGAWVPSFQRPSGSRSTDLWDFTSMTSTPWSGTMTTKSASPFTCRSPGCSQARRTAPVLRGVPSQGSTAASFEPLGAPIRPQLARVVARDDLDVGRDAEHPRCDDAAEALRLQLKPQVAIALQERHIGCGDRFFELIADLGAGLRSLAAQGRGQLVGGVHLDSEPLQQRLEVL